METMTKRVQEFMKAEVALSLSEYGSAFDLAANACSFFSLWEGDHSVPQWLVNMAEEYLGPDES